MGDDLFMHIGKGRFSKIGCFADLFSQQLLTFKSKTAAGRNTIDSLQHISQMFIALEVFMVNGGTHFNCNEVQTTAKTKEQNCISWWHTHHG